MATSRPSLELFETARDRITILADFPHLSPALLFDYWTSADLLKKWWPQGRVATKSRRDLPLLLAQTRLASSGQVHHVRKREDARVHMEVGSRIHRRNEGHTTLPPDAKRGHKTHPSARRLLEELRIEKDKGRTC